MSSGASALTSRGMTEKDFEIMVDFLNEAVNIAAELKAKTGE